MSTMSIATPGVAGAPSALGPIVAATDGTESSAAALAAARLIAGHTGSDVEVLSVLEPMPLFAAPTADALPVAYPDVDASRLDELRDLVRRQADAASRGRSWSTEARLGDPATVIAERARERHAGLVVAGIGHHSVLQRMLGAETVVRLAHAATTPLLAVAPTMDRLPRRALVAVDLDPPGAQTAPSRAALSLLSAAETVYCIHVQPHADRAEHARAEWDRAYAELAHQALERVRESLLLPPRTEVRLITLTGHTARAILEFAAAAKVELIVVGRRRRGALRRAFAGSTTTRLLRGATCSVLVIPDPAPEAQAAADARRQARTDTVREPEWWPVRLREFSRLNAGRLAALEVDDAELGAQTVASAHPFLGADYDRADGRVEIVLGSDRPGAPHLSHSVPDALSLDFLENPDGSDRALRIAGNGGQTLLTFRD
jgi:nucleotide-binding universal stress UspA family protein